MLQQEICGPSFFVGMKVIGFDSSKDNITHYGNIFISSYF